MPKFKNQFARVDTVLVADVADSGTFTVSYPTGYAQNNFTGGLAGTGHYAIINGNDRWTAAASKMAVTTFGSTTITITNNSGVTWKAGSAVSIFIDIVDGNSIHTLTFAIDLASITAADVITSYYPRIAGKIEYVGFEVDKAVSTAAKAATLTPKIGSTALTGGVISLTSAAATPKGTVIDGTAVTGNNVLTTASAISVTASSVTQFAEGTGNLIIRIRADMSESV